ncbi:hypothetical protein [Sphingomonas phyllosphaerae]|uniref:hypothetical protein n=1 Tax=Sphingomonas phyllosphaerae TaxID=257003 RepID=UPI002413B05F|nr:hypothetical protein [Sphingomonas phyllosphaerae]
MIARGEVPAGASPTPSLASALALSSAAIVKTVTLAPRPRPIAAAGRLAAEAFGTFWLVAGGGGAAVRAAGSAMPGSSGLVGRWLFGHEARGQSPGQTSDRPIERLVDADRAATPRWTARTADRRRRPAVTD